MNKYKVTHYSAMEISIPIKEEEQAPFYAKHRPLIIERSEQLDTNKNQSSKIIEMSEWFDFADEYTEEGYSNAWVEPKWETEVVADNIEEAINKVKDGYYNCIEGETIGDTFIHHDTVDVIIGESFEAELIKE
tara:strand:+ start:412 stop:810 length:399 start_codon:yes stop_codon:yes gene_type:complete